MEDQKNYQMTKKEKGMTFPVMLEKFKGEIARALPKHLSADRMCRIALTEFRKNPKLAKCDPTSVFAAIIQSSQLGLEVGLMGEAYLVPFKEECQLIAGYTGLMKLAMNTGNVSDIYVHSVREKDEFEIAFGLDRSLKHKPLMNGSFPASDEARGPIVGYYAVAVFTDGKKTFQAMSNDEVLKIRDNSKGYKASKAWGKESTWDTHPEAMGMKTVIRRLCKYLPKSPELAAALAMDDVIDVSGKQKLTVQDAIDGTWAPDYSDGAIDASFNEVPEKTQAESVDEQFTAEFSGMIETSGVAFSELDKFIDILAGKKKITTEAVKISAVEEKDRFIDAFRKHLAKQAGTAKAEPVKEGTKPEPEKPSFPKQKPPILCPKQGKGVFPGECDECESKEKCDPFGEWRYDKAQKGE